MLAYMARSAKNDNQNATLTLRQSLVEGQASDVFFSGRNKPSLFLIDLPIKACLLRLKVRRATCEIPDDAISDNPASLPDRLYTRSPLELLRLYLSHTRRKSVPTPRI
jgi:hypothetical protein